MKNQKLNLADFKQHGLSRECISTIKAGIPTTPPKPGQTATGTGSGTGGNCYWDFETQSLICDEVEPKEEPIITTPI